MTAMVAIAPNRPDWGDYYMRLAYLAATRATCPRKHVGAILAAPSHRIEATGYNGAPAGAAQCDEVGCQMIEGHCVRTLHAESNCLDFAGRYAAGCDLYVTVTPCWDCAKRIVNAGIIKVTYDEHYESRYGKSADVPTFLQDHRIKVVRFEEGRMRRFKELLQLLDKPVDIATPVHGVPIITPASCAVHRFSDNRCVVCGLVDTP
jgi:dCMP deaminase